MIKILVVIRNGRVSTIYGTEEAEVQVLNCDRLIDGNEPEERHKMDGVLDEKTLDNLTTEIISSYSPEEAQSSAGDHILTSV